MVLNTDTERRIWENAFTSAFVDIVARKRAMLGVNVAISALESSTGSEAIQVADGCVRQFLIARKAQ